MGVSALVIASMPVVALAQTANPLFGTVFGEYGSIDAGGGSNADVFLGGVNANLKIAPGFALQGDVAFGTADFSGGGGNADLWALGGGITYRPGNMSGRLGGTLEHLSVDPGGGSLSITYYSGCGESFLGDSATIRLRGGGFSGTGSTDGFHIGGGGNFYPADFVSINAYIDYQDFDSGGDITDLGAEGEVRPFATVPITAYGGYNRTNFSGFGDANTWRLGLKAYLGTIADNTIASYHRHEAIKCAPKLRLNF